MSKRVTLTISIPTYNRAAYLRRGVMSVIDQMGTLPPGLSLAIRIYDNASTDDTPEVCAGISQRLPQVQIVRRAQNIGGDPNILAAMLEPDSDFIWVLGDDDYLRGGALAKLGQLLLAASPALVKLGNLEERDRGGESGTANLQAAAIGTQQLELVRFQSADQILARFGLGLGNFSSLIFSHLFLDSAYRTPSPEMFSSGYSQLEWVYSGLRARPEAFCSVETPVLVIRIEINPRDVSAERVGLGMRLLQDALLHAGYDHKVVDTFYRAQHEATLVGIIKSRKLAESLRWKDLVATIRALSSSRNRLKVVVIAVLPPFVFKRIWQRLGAAA